MNQPIGKAQLSRIKPFASRVRTLGVEGGLAKPRVSATHSSLPELLLPRLNTLHWDGSLGPLRDFFPKHTSLVHLSIRLEHLDKVDLTSLASIGDAGSSIKSLAFTDPHVEYVVPTEHERCLSDFLEQLPSLERFECNINNLPTQLYIRLAAIPSLRTIFLNIEEQKQPFCDLFDSPNPLTFKNLEGLKLYADDFFDLMIFIRATPLAALRDIHVDVFCIEDCQTIRQLFSYLKTNSASDHLTSLTLSVGIGSDDAGDEGSIECELLLPDDIRPLLSCQNLQHLTFDVSHSFQMDDDMLKKMAQSWPSLETLRLNSYCGWQDHSQCTWTGFIALLRGCRSLRKVAIALRTTEGCSLDEIPVGFVRHGLLSHVDFLDTPIISDPHELATLLSALSIKLYDVCAWSSTLKGGDHKKWSTIWAEVQRHLRRTIEIRADERKRMFANR